MDDANVDPEEYCDRVTDADAQAASLTESPEAQAYLSEVTLIDSVRLCPENNVPRTYAQAVDPSNEFNTEWREATERELSSITHNGT